MTVGRTKNADPKWLIPLICRLGHVTKKDIGVDPHLRPGDQVRDRAGDRPRASRQAVKQTAEEDIRIEPAGPPPEADAKVHKPKPYLKRRGPPGKGPPKRRS